MQRLTAAEVVLLAMLRLGLNSAFDQDRIAVAAWELKPATFGMHGYNLPNNKRVTAELCKMRKAGLIDLVRTRTYMLTQRGLARAAIISDRVRAA